MAFSGFKKQFNKVNQYVTEKVGVAEATQMHGETVRLEEQFTATCDLVADLQTKTKEFLQPNPSARAMMLTVKGFSMVSGQPMDTTYPQPEGAIAECLAMYGTKLGEDNTLGISLLTMAESMKKMALAKYALDDRMRQNFLEPLHEMETKELKEVTQQRKKMESRRLDFDGRRRKLAKAGSSTRTVNDDEVRLAEEKFAESLHLAQMGMHSVLETDAEQIGHLEAFGEALVEYHQQCAGIMRDLVKSLHKKRLEAEYRPRPLFTPKTLEDLRSEGSWKGVDDSPPPYSPTSPTFYGSPPPYSPPGDDHPSKASRQNGRTPVVPPKKALVATPSCTAIYDFEPEKTCDLGFKAGDIIMLIKRLDDNWMEGSLNGRTGYFPKNFVQIDVPLP